MMSCGHLFTTETLRSNAGRDLTSLRVKGSVSTVGDTLLSVLGLRVEIPAVFWYADSRSPTGGLTKHEAFVWAALFAALPGIPRFDAQDSE
jgi:hypothetical protein